MQYENELVLHPRYEWLLLVLRLAFHCLYVREFHPNDDHQEFSERDHRVESEFGIQLEVACDNLPQHRPMSEWLPPKRISWPERIVRQWFDPNVPVSVAQQFCMNRHFVIVVAFRLWLFRGFSSVTREIEREESQN